MTRRLWVLVQGGDVLAGVGSRQSMGELGVGGWHRSIASLIRGFNSFGMAGDERCTAGV
jgi:hypothetical protein